MPKLSYVEEQNLKNILEIRGGYTVLETNKNFIEFFNRLNLLNTYSLILNNDNFSKGKRLWRFIEESSNNDFTIFLTAINELLEYKKHNQEDIVIIHDIIEKYKKISHENQPEMSIDNKLIKNNEEQRVLISKYINDLKVCESTELFLFSSKLIDYLKNHSPLTKASKLVKHQIFNNIFKNADRENVNSILNDILIELSDDNSEEILQKKKLFLARYNDHKFYDNIRSLILKNANDDYCYSKINELLPNFAPTNAFTDKYFWTSIDNILESINLLFSTNYNFKLYDEITVKKELSTLIDNSCNHTNLPFKEIFNINILNDLLSNEKNISKHTNINELREDAIRLYMKNEYLSSIHSLTNLLEILCNYQMSQTNESPVVKLLSKELTFINRKDDRKLFYFAEQLNALWKVACDYGIRHGEKDNKIKDKETLQYLFFTLINIIHLIIIKQESTPPTQ